MAEIGQAHKDLLSLWGKIRASVIGGDCPEALRLLDGTCPLCDFYADAKSECPLPIIMVRCSARLMPICSCTPSLNVVRWRISALVQQMNKSVSDERFRDLQASCLRLIDLAAVALG